VPSFKEQILAAQDEILSWEEGSVGSKTYQRHRKRSALEGLRLLKQLMLVDHQPIADTIVDGIDKGTAMQTATCYLCGTDIDRYEDVDRDRWEIWRAIPDANRCFGLVKP
jgi:hypothetical protein